jgi:hypothetical protein
MFLLFILLPIYLFFFNLQKVDMCLTTEPAHLFGVSDLPEYAAWSEGHGLVITALVAGLPQVTKIRINGLKIIK